MAVEDPDAHSHRVSDLGGTVLKQPADIPGVGRFAIVRDPVGGVLAIMRFGEA